MATLFAWQVAMVVNAGFCGWASFTLFHQRRFVAAAIGAVALAAALIGAVVSLSLYIMA